MTSHERRSGRSWDASYHDESPAPWDIGDAQPAIARIADRIASPVLDAGCGTGDNAAMLVARGLAVFGFDVAPTAVAIARERAPHGEFAVADAFDLEALGRMFATVIDSGLFHTFDRDERSRYAASLASVTEHGSTVFVLCFADEGPCTGPHPVARDDLHAAFAAPRWRVESIEPEQVATNFGTMAGWLATITRT